MTAPSHLIGQLGYKVSVAVDVTGVSAPVGSGDRPRDVASLDEAIGLLCDAAEAGVEYACVEITRIPVRPGPDTVPVAGERL